MKFESQVVHAGDRKRERPTAIPSTTPIHLATTYFYDTAEQLDRIFGHEEEGPSYARYENPTNSALEDLDHRARKRPWLPGHLLGNDGPANCFSSGAARPSAFHRQFQLHLWRNSQAARSSSGAVRGQRQICRYVRFGAVEKAIAAEKPGCVFLESISNPLLRVADIPQIAAMTHAAGAALVVDSTFACPMLMRPLDLGAQHRRS